MSIPLKAITYDPGLGGIPTTANPRDLSGWADTYADSLVNELGAESCRIVGRCASIEEAVDWTERLMAAIEVYTPAGKPRFFGFLHEVSIPALEVSLSLTDMANVVIVRYTDPDGKKGSQIATNSASIAKYGRKELVLNFSTAYAAEATNRAATVLAQLAQPPNKETVSTEPATGPYRVELTFRGWAETLKWLTTSSTTTATAVTSTQATSLISTYNSTNAFFDTAGAAVVSTGFSATQFCDPDTTYFERIATLLAAGNSSQQRVAWGFYTRAITIAAAASAAADTIAYYYSKRKGELRDANNNVVPVWDWIPDTMIRNTDALHPPASSGTTATLTRKYIRRVTCSIDEQGEVKGTLEPDDPDKLPEFLAKPISVTSGVSARHAQIEARIARTAKIRTIAADNPLIYNPATGVLLPGSGGTGVVNTGTIDTGGGNVGNTGGGNVDLGTGGGIGGAGSSAALGSGTAGRVAEWLTSSTLQAATLIKSGAGVLTLAASGAFTLTVPATGTTALGTGTTGAVTKWSGTNTLTNAVSGTDYSAPGHTHTAGDVSGIVDGTGTAGRVAEWLDANTIDASTLIKAGAGTLTLSAATTSTLTIGGAGGTLTLGGSVLTLSGNFTSNGGTLNATGTTLTIDNTMRLASSAPATGDVLTYNGTAYANAAPTTGAPDNATYIVKTASAGLSAEQALGALATGILKSTTTTGVVSIAVAGTDFLDGSGTNGRLAEWGASNALANSTLIKSGAGVLTITTASTQTITIGGATGGTLTLGGNVLSITGNLSSNGGTYNGAGTTLTVPATGTAALGTGSAANLAYWTGANVLNDAAGASYDGATDRVTATNMTIGTNLRCNGFTTSGSVNVNSSASPTHALQLTGTDDATKSATTTWTVVSDRRSKTILGPYTRGLDFLRSLPQVVDYEHNGKFGTVAGMRSMNFIAQEVEAVAPEWIGRDTHTDEDGTETEILRLNSHEHIYALHNALLELAERMDQHGL